MSDVYVLGAGFSKAVNRVMPTLEDLRELVIDALDDRYGPLDSQLAAGDLELWLSYLSGDQPWLDEPERLRNRAWFVKVSRVLAEVIAARETAARSGQMPTWLRVLVARWHHDRASVVTFNYDTLIEAAYTEVVKVRSRNGSEDGPASHRQLYQNATVPISSRAGSALGAAAVDTFQLIKLHGSRSWMYSGRTSYFGESIYDAGRMFGWAPEAEDPRPWLSDDKTPLIVPPTAGKNGFFDNETVRREWSRAFGSVASATRVIVVGYSFPPSDLLARFLIQEAASSDAEIVVVNPDKSVAPRVAEILGRQPEWVCSVEEWTEALPPVSAEPIAYLRDS